MIAEGKFVLVIDCMDGRIQPLSREIVDKQFDRGCLIDNVTLAGPDGLLAKAGLALPDGGPLVVDDPVAEAAQKEIAISLNQHHASGVVLIGHQDCAGNPVSEEQHLADIKRAVGWIRQTIANQELPPVPVIGVYAFRKNSDWSYRLVD